MPNFIQIIDENILFYIQEHLKSPALDRVMVFITSLGNAGFFWIVVAFLLMLQKRYQKCGISLICAISIAMFFSDDLLKPLFDRVRPCNNFPEIALLIPGPHSPSFPSGHTLVGFASATILYYYHHQFGVVGFILASLIAYSRLYLFVHYPTDILGGIVFGISTSLILIYWLNKVYHDLDNGFTKFS